TQAGVRGHVLSLDQAGGRNHRIRDEELRPAEALHAHRERDRLPGSLGLAHHPVELAITVLVDLIPVGGEADDTEVHRLEPGEGRASVQAQVGGTAWIETDPDLDRLYHPLGPRRRP